MNKKTNTIWFILGATVFNILTTIICFVLLLVLYVKLNLPESTVAWGFPLIFIGAIVLSFLIYRLVIKQVMKKVEMEKYFDPIFGRRKK